MNDKTAGNRGPRRAGVLAVAAAVTVLAAACSAQTYAAYSTGSGPAGSAAWSAP
jgi:hypothetical protein